MAWDAYLKVKWDNENSMDYAKKQAMKEGREEGIRAGIEEGREEGIKAGKEEGRKEGIKAGKEEGRKEGIEEGIEEGIKEGIKEGKSEIARNMKSKGFDIQTISEITGLMPEEIRNA